MNFEPCENDHSVDKKKQLGFVSKLSRQEGLQQGFNSDLAALLRGEVDDLLLPLDAGSARVALT